MKNPTSESQRNSNSLDTLQKIRPDLLGFVFQLSWLYLLLYDNALTENIALSSTANILYMSSAIPLIVTLIVGIAAPHKFQVMAESSLGVYGAPAITALGTIFYCVNFTFGSFPLMILGGIFTGIGSAILAVRWATAFGRVSSREILENFPLLLAIVFVICVSCLYIPVMLRYGLVIILPILSGIFLQYAKHYAGENSRHKSSLSPLSSLPRWVRSPGIALGCVGLVGLLGFNAGLLISFKIGDLSYAGLFYMATAIIILGFVGTLLFQMDRSSVLLIFGLPLTIIIVTFLPFAQFLVSSPVDALPSIGNIAFELMLLTGCVLFALVTDRAVGRTFMIGRCTMAIFDLLGSIAGDQISVITNVQWPLQVAAICLLLAVELLLFGLIAGYFAIKRIQKSRVRVSLESDEAKSAVSGQDRFEFQEENLREEKHQEEAAVPAEKGTSLDERIEVIATQYGLSARERDVFSLLAKGRSSARIQEDLCIAAGTVNYHTRNIYAKLGVHSRQEIIDLLDNRQ